MFTRAVNSHNPSRPPPPPPTRTQPPATKQLSLHNAFSTSTKKPASAPPPPTSRNTVEPLRPPPPSAPNHPRPLHALSAAYSDASVFRENSPPPTPSTADQGSKDGMSQLHDAVYFDEGDFESDVDLDFDEGGPVITYQSPPQSSRYTQKVSHAAAPPQSSVPVPWSSSPVEHMQPTKRAEPEEDLDELPERKKVRRTIPWEKAKQEAKKQEAKKHQIHQRPVASRGEHANDLLPWNDSFASVALGRKEVRMRNAAKQQKRSMSTGIANLEDVKRAKKGKETVARLFLSEEQRRVVDLVSGSGGKLGESVFFTGSAGTGKSVLLREIIAVLKRAHRKDSDAVAVTASTGLAACNIGGVTLHSFAGIGLGKEPVADLVKKVKKNAKARMRWIRTKILIMDEVSMVDGDLFDKLEQIARTVRNNGRPFGGIQLIITGDFFQLPPVPERSKMAKFAFDASSWNTCISHTIGLTQVFRQRDPEFARMLNEMRLGYLSPETVKTFQQLSRPIQYDDGIQATELFSTRNEVDTANTAKMRQLPGEAMRFASHDGGTSDPQFRTKLLASCMAPQTIDLKIHSQVMLIKNVDDSLVNGSLGRVVGFMSESSFRISCESDDGKEKTDGGGTDTARRWPLVQFALIDGTSRQLLCQPEIWKVELPNGEVQAERSQVPLILAWALSIHKAQGQTLERVKVDLGRVFEKGQAYVALSRATCKEGLQVLRFDAKKVMAHDKVRQFYDSLYSPAEAAKRKAAAQPAVLKGLGMTSPKKTVGKRSEEEEEYEGFEDEPIEMGMY